MKVVNVKQGTDEWLRARIGIPTASDFDNLVTPNFQTKDGAARETYLYRKLTEKVMGFPLDNAGSWAMEQGTILETEAIPYYELVYDIPVQRVGFCTTDDGRIGCSPDGLIGDDDGLEVKCPLPQTHLRYLLEGGIPKDYMAQIHGAMFVTGRAKWTFLSYSRQFPALVVHVERDERIQGILRNTLEAFLLKFDSSLAKVKAMRDAENAAKTEAYYASQPENDK